MSAQAGWALTRTLKKLSMVAAAICAHAANGSVAGADECHAVTSIEIVHRTGSSTTTSTVRLAPGASADPNQALRAFQRAADHFGQENIVSSRPIRTVQCMEAESPDDLARASAVSILGSELCVLDDEVYSCEALPGDGFDYGEGTNCSVFDMGEALSYTCDDSGLIISDQGDVVITVNSANIQAEVLARTQALRRLLGDANVLTNFHFNIVLSPDQEAALVSNDSFAEVADEIRRAAELGHPLPDIQELLAGLPEEPTNMAFFEQLEKAYELRQQRLELLGKITTGAQLSPQQVNAFYENFVGRSRRIDELVVERSAASLAQAADLIDQTLAQLMSADPASTIFEELKALASALVDAHTQQGVFDPEGVVRVVPNLYQHLTDEDLIKRMLAGERLIAFNELLRQGPDPTDVEQMEQYLEALAWRLGQMADGDWEWDEVYHIYDQVLATEFFIENGDPTGTIYDVHLTDDAASMFDITVEPGSAVDYDVIVLLNEVAEYHRATGQVSVNYQAIIGVNARAALATPDVIRQLYHTQEAYNWFDVATGFVGGVVNGFGDMATGIIHVVAHPVATYEGIVAAVTNWEETLAVVWQQGAEMIHRWPNMTPQEKADFMGRVAAEVIAGLPAKARQAGRIGEAAQDAARLHLDKANLGLRIIEQTGVPLTASAATELVKRMERLGATTVNDIIDIADDIDDLVPCDIVGGVSPGLSAPGIMVEPPCSAAEVAEIINKLTSLAQTLGATTDAEIADFVVLSSRVSLRTIGEGLWDTRAGLRYGPDPNPTIQNRVRHVLRHAVDDPSRPGAHGVFDAGTRGTLQVIDEGWTIALGGGPRVTITQNGFRTVYDVNMETRIGFVGGQAGAAAGFPEATHLCIVIKNLRDVVTAFPVETQCQP